ncbi:MAG: hypothetical protein NZ927_06950 [Candidatus Calescibacterium sp.]|nr:hypothetical protein [Candidatus Calescibacterium sp.]MCX7734515.1 hypothetical protein [bacterium]
MSKNTIVLATIFIFSLLNLSSKPQIEDERYPESLLRETIYYLKEGDFKTANEKLQQLKIGIKDEKKLPIDEMFPTISFPIKISDALSIIESEIKIGIETKTKEVPFAFVTSSWNPEFFKANQEIFLNALQRFENLNFVPDAFVVDLIGNEKKIVINFSSTPLYSSPINTVVNIRRNDQLKKQIYFIPDLSYLSEALSLFSKRELKCKAISIIHPKDRKDTAEKIKEVAWAFGISAPLNIQYEGIDLIPFFREKGNQMLKKKVSDQEIFSAISREFENIKCILILDNPRNSATIIPQFRFIGASDLYFLGFFWYKMKDIIEKRYFERIFYVDIVDEKISERTKVYISELKKLSDLLLITPNVKSEKIEIDGEIGKISISPGNYVTRPVFIFRLGENIQKVFEYYKDEPAITE